MFEFIYYLIMSCINYLPTSPFSSAMADYTLERLDFLPQLNWFIPFDNCLQITNLWASCILAYYVFNFVKSVGFKYIIDKIL